MLKSFCVNACFMSKTFQNVLHSFKFDLYEPEKNSIVNLVFYVNEPLLHSINYCSSSPPILSYFDNYYAKLGYCLDVFINFINSNSANFSRELGQDCLSRVMLIVTKIL